MSGSPPTPPLPGDLVLVPAPGLAIRALPDGRLFVAATGAAGPGRMLALGGVAEADLRFVLDQLDGRRTVTEVLDRVADSDDERRAVAGLLASLERRGLLAAPERAPTRAATRTATEDPASRPAATPPIERPVSSAVPRSSGSVTVTGAPAKPATVGIVGGGTAGHLAALALRRVHPEIAVTLIESPDVPVIGVGEATTPLLPQFLHADLGLDVHRLFREVRPTLKLGIRFGWGEGEGFSYPFGALDLSWPPDPADPSDRVEPARRAASGPARSLLDDCSLGAALMAAGALPLVPEDGSMDGSRELSALRSGLGTEVAYHLENRRFTAYLAGRAAAAGVRRLEARIETVERVEPAAPAAGGEGIAALHTADGRRLTFDLYVDCSGFRSLLMGGGTDRRGSPFRSYERSLFTDGAVIGTVARRAPEDGRLLPHTVATARSAGWSWRIPQEGEDHLGAVFCAAHGTAEEAEAELRAAHPGLGPVRSLRFRPGRREHFWRGNTVALGNAYGFVEPLESTAIHLAIRQILLLIDHLPLPADPAERRALQERLNRRVADHWDYVAWFLALHFKYNRRLDTPFWRACRAEVDVARHGELIEAFRAHGPLSGQEPGFAYPDPLWGPEGIDVLLFGQGVPCPRPVLPSGVAAARSRRRAGWRRLAERALPAADALRLLSAQPVLLEGLAEAFRRHGPASAVLAGASPNPGNSEAATP